MLFVSKVKALPWLHKNSSMEVLDPKPILIIQS